MLSVDMIISLTNVCDNLELAGGLVGKYASFLLFSINEIMKHIGIYMLNGLSPSPQAELKMKSPVDDPIHGLTFFNEVFEKNGLKRHKEFKCYLCLVDPCIPTPSKITHPNWKVDSILKKLHSICKKP